MSKTHLQRAESVWELRTELGVSFIRAEGATEAMVVSMDSNSMSSMSNESTIFCSICHCLKGNIFDRCSCNWFF